MNRLIKSILYVFLLANSHLAFAEFATLDNANSSVSFVTTKVQDIQEVMYFEHLSGQISDEGQVEISIDATSINSAIPIRDDRMKEHLFEVASYPEIKVMADIDIASLPVTGLMQIPATLQILGMEHSLELNLLASVNEERILVASTQPVLVSAGDLGLADGLEILGKLAGGIWIGQSVPVSFALTFDLAD